MLKFLSATLSDLTSQAATYSTSVLDLREFHSVSFQLTATGTASWTFGVEHSNDGVNWASVQTPTAYSSSTTLVINVADSAARYYRVTMTRTSGTLTTATITYCAKAKRG
jgi:hypothetical protein